MTAEELAAAAFATDIAGRLITRQAQGLLLARIAGGEQLDSVAHVMHEAEDRGEAAADAEWDSLTDDARRELMHRAGTDARACILAAAFTTLTTARQLGIREETLSAEHVALFAACPVGWGRWYRDDPAEVKAPR